MWARESASALLAGRAVARPSACYQLRVAMPSPIYRTPAVAADVPTPATCAEESKQRRTALSFRSAQPGDRKVTFRKPNAATEGIMLGLKFRENFQKGVFIDKIIDGTEAARLKREGKISEGDEITMVSATFGDEMWSARGVGKYRLEKSIAVRQGMTISFVVENRNDNDAKKRAKLEKEAEKERARVNRLQDMVRARMQVPLIVDVQPACAR